MKSWRGPRRYPNACGTCKHMSGTLHVRYLRSVPYLNDLADSAFRTLSFSPLPSNTVISNRIHYRHLPYLISSILGSPQLGSDQIRFARTFRYQERREWRGPRSFGSYPHRSRRSFFNTHLLLFKDTSCPNTQSNWNSLPLKSLFIYSYLFSLNSALHQTWLTLIRRLGYIIQNVIILIYLWIPSKDACVTRTKALSAPFRNFRSIRIYCSASSVHDLFNHSTCQQSSPKVLLVKPPASFRSTKRTNPNNMDQPLRANELL